MSLENRNLALVEDDPIMGESLMQRLQLEGANVCWWRTGRRSPGGPFKDQRRTLSSATFACPINRAPTCFAR